MLFAEHFVTDYPFIDSDFYIGIAKRPDICPIIYVVFNNQFKVGVQNFLQKYRIVNRKVQPNTVQEVGTENDK